VHERRMTWRQFLRRQSGIMSNELDKDKEFIWLLEGSGLRVAAGEKWAAVLQKAHINQGRKQRRSYKDLRELPKSLFPVLQKQSRCASKSNMLRKLFCMSQKLLRVRQICCNLLNIHSLKHKSVKLISFLGALDACKKQQIQIIGKVSKFSCFTAVIRGRS
jgi:hypothetical protein